VPGQGAARFYDEWRVAAADGEGEGGGGGGGSGSGAKLYDQLKTVAGQGNPPRDSAWAVANNRPPEEGYADYRVGMVYVGAYEVAVAVKRKAPIIRNVDDAANDAAAAAADDNDGNAVGTAGGNNTGVSGGGGGGGGDVGWRRMPAPGGGSGRVAWWKPSKGHGAVIPDGVCAVGRCTLESS
jgi:hypothetical protein